MVWLVSLAKAIQTIGTKISISRHNNRQLMSTVACYLRALEASLSYPSTWGKRLSCPQTTHRFKALKRLRASIKNRSIWSNDVIRMRSWRENSTQRFTQDSIRRHCWRMNSPRRPRWRWLRKQLAGKSTCFVTSKSIASQWIKVKTLAIGFIRVGWKWLRKKIVS